MNLTPHINKISTAQTQTWPIQELCNDWKMVWYQILFTDIDEYLSFLPQIGRLSVIRSSSTK